jgi:hypothetical protein
MGGGSMSILNRRGSRKAQNKEEGKEGEIEKKRKFHPKITTQKG